MKFKIEKHILKKAEELSFITIKHDSEFKVEGYTIPKEGLQVPIKNEVLVKGIKENRPYAKIYVESIYPVEEENAGKRKNKDIKEINKNIEKMCKKEHVDYIDMYSKLKDGDDKLKEEYSKDGLHISNKGYEEITKVIKTYLK